MKAKPVIEHPLLAPFEPQLKALLELGFDGGIRALEAAGYKLGDDLVNDDARECYRNGLLAAFAQTQWHLGLEFIVLEKKRHELLEKVKLLHCGRSPALPDTQLQLETVENRETILRRFMDGILWVLLTPKIWIAQRFAFQRAVRRSSDR